MPNERDLVQTVAAAIKDENLPWTAGPTSVSALPAAEQQKRLGVLVTDAERQRLAADRARFAAQEQQTLGAAVGAPAAVDWRNHNGNYVTSVKDQGQCGSCVGFCSCSTIESAVRVKLQNPSYAIDLSEGFLFFCGGASCANGWGLTSGLDYAKSTGVVDEACMPYASSTLNNGTDMNCGASRCSDWQNRLTKIANYSGYATMEARKNAVAAGPVLAGMAVFYDFFAYSSGVYVKSSNTTLAGYHCISVVGYDDNQQCWILKNSWGTGWGEAGFVKIRYNQAPLLLDSDWSFYSVDVLIPLQWYSNVTVAQTYASRDSQNAWAYIQGLGWRKIYPGAADGVTNMLILFAEASANGRPVTIYADGTYVYQAYLL
ncbi:MAG TPA: C1 family peptidase [Thermomicrobiales bacterium]|jgi:C1A family cysteine protease